MRQLNGLYTQRYNQAHRCVGHVFQGRYKKTILIEKDSYLPELARYIVLNPVRAGMVRSAKDWPWSSYRATAEQLRTGKGLTSIGYSPPLPNVKPRQLSVTKSLSRKARASDGPSRNH